MFMCAYTVVIDNTIQHGTVLIIFTLILQTIIIAPEGKCLMFTLVIQITITVTQFTVRTRLHYILTSSTTHTVRTRLHSILINLVLLNVCCMIRKKKLFTFKPIPKFKN